MVEVPGALRWELHRSATKRAKHPRTRLTPTAVKRSTLNKVVAGKPTLRRLMCQKPKPTERQRVEPGVVKAKARKRWPRFAHLFS